MLWCGSGEEGFDSPGIGPPWILHVIKERHVLVDTRVACQGLRSCGSECDVMDLPSVLHLNAVTARAPLTFFSTTSQSPSTA